MRDQHLYKSPTIEVYGHCRLLLPWLRVPGWFFCNPRYAAGNWTHNPLDLCSQSGAYDLSAKATPRFPLLLCFTLNKLNCIHCHLKIMSYNSLNRIHSNHHYSKITTNCLYILYNIFFKLWQKNRLPLHNIQLLLPPKIWSLLIWSNFLSSKKLLFM